MKIMTKSTVAALAALALPMLALAAGYVGPTNPGGVPEGDATTIIKNVLNWILGIIAIAAITGIAISGVLYVTSGGDKERTDTAKKWLLYSIVGLVIALLGYAIVKTVGVMLGGGGGTTT